MIKKLLVANRGEIALRIIRTCKELGIKTVMPFSKADKNSLPVKLSDEAYCLGGPSSKETYLNIDKILKIAKKSKSDAIHPGYGFLSENSEFTKRRKEEKIVFIGPSPKTMRTLGDKITARRLAKKMGVPVMPGSIKPIKNVREALDLTWEHAKEWFSLHIGSVEPSEGLWAFKEKRKTDYREIRKFLGEGGDPQFPFGPYLSECKKCETKYLPHDSKYCLVCSEKIEP